MLKHKRLSLAVFVVMVVVLNSLLSATFATHAQDDEALERIDQAMAHLSDLLDRPITREDFDWRWSERIYPDDSLGCPAPDISYTSQQIRAIQVRIFVDGTEYDYRVSVDGERLVLCNNGQPAQSSIGVPLPDAPVEEEVLESLQEPLGQRAWWSWVYNIELDSLYLVNPTDAERLSLPRPKLPQEVAGATPQLAVSRDGRILIVANELTTGVNGLGFYAFETGRFIRTHQLRPAEDIYLGAGYDAISLSGSPYIVSADNRFVAVGLATMDFSSPGWRVVVFDLNTGEALYQLEKRSPQVQALGAAFTSNDIVFPRILYYGDDEIHVQLIRFGADAEPEYPALVWQPNRNTVTQSPFTRTNIDILPNTQQAVTTYVDSALPATTNGLFPANNALGVGMPEPTALYTLPNADFSAPRWAANGERIVFRTRDAEGNIQWQQFIRASAEVLSLDAATEVAVGTPAGVLLRTATGIIQAVNTDGATVPLLQTPEGTRSVILWVTPPDSTFALQSVYIPLNLTGIVHCPGTPVSEVAIGSEAVATVSLRIRNTPGGEFVVTMTPDTEFIVVGGPECQGTYTWWRIRLADGTTGWAAEGDTNLYFIQPPPGDAS